VLVNVTLVKQEIVIPVVVQIAAVMPADVEKNSF